MNEHIELIDLADGTSPVGEWRRVGTDQLGQEVWMFVDDEETTDV